jgi:hypothetical protein
MNIMDKGYTFQLFGDRSEGLLKVLIIVNNEKLLESSYYSIIFDEVYRFLKNRHIFDLPLSCYIGVVDDGVLTMVNEGILHQINNTALHTFGDFEQHHENRISRVLDRDMDALVEHSLKYINTYFKYDLMNRDEFDSFKKFHFARILSRLNNHELFHLTTSSANMLAASLGKEYHTNEALANHYITVSPFLRNEADKYNFEALDNFFRLYLEALSRYLKYEEDKL